MTDDESAVYFSEPSRILKVDTATGAVTVVAGSQSQPPCGNSNAPHPTGVLANAAAFCEPYALEMSLDQQTLYIGDKYNYRIATMDLATTAVGELLTGLGSDGGDGRTDILWLDATTNTLFYGYGYNKVLA